MEFLMVFLSSIYESMRASYSQIELFRGKPNSDPLGLSKALSARKSLEAEFSEMFSMPNQNKNIIS